MKPQIVKICISRNFNYWWNFFKLLQIYVLRSPQSPHHTSGPLSEHNVGRFWKYIICFAHHSIFFRSLIPKGCPEKIFNDRHIAENGFSFRRTQKLWPSLTDSPLQALAHSNLQLNSSWTNATFVCFGKKKVEKNFHKVLLPHKN